MQIYIYKGGQQHGPYSVEHIRGWLTSGHLLPSDLACYDGVPNWIPLSSVPGVNIPMLPSQPSYQPNPSEVILIAKGVNGQLSLFENKIRISRKGFLGFMTQGSKGNKDILISSISSIQFKPSGLITSGYIQFAFSGGSENKGGLLDATKDENTVMFKSSQQKAFEMIRQAVEQKMEDRLNASQRPIQQRSNLDELEKLANLRDKGIITEDEFNVQKKRLLGL